MNRFVKPVAALGLCIALGATAATARVRAADDPVSGHMVASGHDRHSVFEIPRLLLYRSPVRSGLGSSTPQGEPSWIDVWHGSG